MEQLKLWDEFLSSTHRQMGKETNYAGLIGIHGEDGRCSAGFKILQGEKNGRYSRPSPIQMTPA